MTLPERFRDATFESYEPQTPSQAEALRVARAFVAELRRTPSWAERLRALLGAADERLPQGLYLVGPAGTGKTHLLAATCNALMPERACAFLHSSTLFRQTEPPDDWFDPDRHAGLARAVAEKFDRTVSRLHALCQIRPVEQKEAGQA